MTGEVTVGVMSWPALPSCHPRLVTVIVGRIAGMSGIRRPGADSAGPEAPPPGRYFGAGQGLPLPPDTTADTPPGGDSSQSRPVVSPSAHQRPPVAAE